MEKQNILYKSPINSDFKELFKNIKDITLNDIELNTMFNEQKTILCNIQTILENNKSKENYIKFKNVCKELNGNCSRGCNKSGVDKTEEFQKLLNNMKKKYSIFENKNLSDIDLSLKELKIKKNNLASSEDLQNYIKFISKYKKPSKPKITRKYSVVKSVLKYKSKGKGKSKGKSKGKRSALKSSKKQIKANKDANNTHINANYPLVIVKTKAKGKTKAKAVKNLIFI